MPIKKEIFGTTSDGQEVQRYILYNDNNMEARIMTYGGIITHLCVPGKDGKVADVVLGFDNFARYSEKHPYFGALIGRYGNRIGGAKFTLDGVQYQLEANNKDVNALHGGYQGFDKRLWEASVEGDKLLLRYVSADGEAGYPGEVTTVVSYQLTSDNKLMINYWAETDKPTVINLTNHSYFNLAGHDHGTVADHVIRINASQYCPVDDTLIPLGNLAPVCDTPFDLTQDTVLGTRLEHVPGGFGFDHNYCLGKPESMKHVARVFHPPSGRCMNMYSTEPGVQFYTGSNIGNLQGKDGATYTKFSAMCLEAQHYPNSPNQDKFPSVVLRPGENYMQTTVYEFTVE